MTEPQPPKNDNPKNIAADLIQTHGLDNAVRVAMDGVAKANAEDDNYWLSIWREVRTILKKQQ